MAKLERRLSICSVNSDELDGGLDSGSDEEENDNHLDIMDSMNAQLEDLKEISASLES